MSTPIDPPLSRRAARQAEVSAHSAAPEVFAQPASRRNRSGTPVSVPSSAPTDIAYRTEVRPRVPHYDDAASPPAVVADEQRLTPAIDPPGALRVPSGGAPPLPLVEPLVAPPVAPPAADVQVRRRDFRPPAEQTPSMQTSVFAGPGFDTALDYHTQLTPHQDALPADPVPLTSMPRPEPFVIAVAPVATFDAPVIDVPEVHIPEVDHPTTDESRARDELAIVEQTLSRRELRAMRERAGFAPESVVADVVDPGAEPSPAPAVTPVAEPAPLMHSAAPTAPSPAASSLATGSHWSVGIHDQDDPFENTFSREVGSTVSLSNTNALVLPEMPIGSIAGPVAGTGEIIITGMIDLSRAVSSTGAVPTVHESPDIDDLFEPGDLAAAPADAAPVSALRAISSHTGTLGVMATSGRRPSSNTITTVLVATTVIMAVVAIGLFVLAAMNGLF